MVDTDEKETNGPTEVLDVEEPKETDKMLKEKAETKKDEAKPEVEEKKETAPEKPVNGEEISKVPENNTSPVTEEGREVKPKKIPIGGIKMPGFFTKNKAKDDTDCAETGELLQKAASGEDKGEATKEESADKKQDSFATRFRNFFARKSTTSEETKADESVKTTDENGQPQKKGLLNAIKLPIANIIPKKLKPVNGVATDDVELGTGPKNRAGLASMETLDDSLKDNDGKDQTDKAIAASNDHLETIKLNETNEEKEKEKKKEDDTKEEDKNLGCWARVLAYKCSVDDLAILGGILLFILLVAIICLFTFSGTPLAHSAPLRDGKFIQAVTTCGIVEGVLEDGAYAFRGIPYALPPLGENRWKSAEKIGSIENCWNGTFLAHNSTPVCMQYMSNSSITGSEDCLTLDVVTPHVRYDNPLPVVVLIGGESLTGDSPGKLRPSTRYARAKDVIFVRPNFRLGAFGFLALDALSKTHHPPRSGNYALSDILAALNWIQLNIEHFGGDRKAVTLLGHRAGGTLVAALTTSPLSKGLFARSWISSAAGLFPGKPLKEYEWENQKFMGEVNCKDADCLYKTDAEVIMNSVPDTWRRVWPDLPTNEENSTEKHEWMVLDGEILQQHPNDVWMKEVAGAPKMVIGTTAHESHSIKLLEKHVEWTPELVRKHIEQSKIGQLGLTDEALKLYNATYQGLVAMVSDIRTVCPLLYVARLQPSVPFYLITQVGGDLNIADVDSDIQAIVGRYEPKTVEQRRYVSAIQQLFYHYVSHGEIKQFEPRRRVLDIGQDALSVDNLPNCDFWIKHDVVLRYARLD